MISRFLTLGKMPELRMEPQGSEEERPVPELEVSLRIEDYWEVSELMRQFRYATASGQSTGHIWKRIARIIAPGIITERDRLWFARNTNFK